jgi:oxygen-independent coproporphyrinogen-3 oxidase
VYRDQLWRGADLAALGVASFGHVNGVHLQNLDRWEDYDAAIDRGELPLGRSYRPSEDEKLIREVILQLKKGSISPAYYLDKFGADVRTRFADVWTSIRDDGFLAELSDERISLTRQGLLRVDMLLHRFFLPEHQGVRYT